MAKIEIDQKIIDKTECDFDFACLKNNLPFCKVERCIDKVCFLSSVSDSNCNNKIYFGDSIICNCPVRIEIYDKYGK